MPKIGGITISTIFFVFFAITALWAVYLHFAPRGRGEGRLARALTAAPIPIAAGFMALVFIASMVAGIVRQYPTYSNALGQPARVQRRLRAGRRRARRAGQQCRLHGAPADDNYGPLGPLGGVNPTGFSPDGVPDRTLAESVKETSVPQPGTDYDWDAPPKLTTPGINGSTVPLPYGLEPRPGSAGRQLHHRRATAEQADLGVVPAAETR